MVKYLANLVGFLHL